MRTYAAASIALILLGMVWEDARARDRAPPPPAVPAAPNTTPPDPAEPQPPPPAEPVGPAVPPDTAAATPAADPADLPTLDPADPLLSKGTLWSVVQPRISLGYFNGPGFGYANGYSVLNGFIPVYGGSLNHLVYLDVRGILSDLNTLYGHNLGMGYRYYSPSLNRIFGAWSSWDMRDTNAAVYNQVSGGIETTGRYLDFHGNVYVVTGSQQSTQTGDVMVPTPFFQSTYIMLPHLLSYETPLSGTDMEIGGPVPGLRNYGVRAYAGGYAFHGDTVGQFGGAQARLAARLSNNFDMGLQVRNDHIFGTTVVFGAALRWGGVRRQFQEEGRDAVFNRFADPVVRNYNVALADPTKVVDRPTTDPVTGLPIIVIHVNNLSPAGGNGTFEHPLNTLAGAATLGGNRAIILVEPGNGTSQGMNQGIVLLPGQRLLGDSMGYSFLSRELGTALLPNVPTGTPIITNINGAAVVLSNGNEVAGLNIASPVGAGISGTGINGFNIHNVNITGAGASGILLSNVSGVGSIVSTTAMGSFLDGAAIGTASTGSLNLLLANDSFNGNSGNGLTLTAINTSSLSTNITGVNLDNNLGNGLNLSTNDTARMNVTVTNGNKIGNGGAGIQMTQGGVSTLNATVNSDPISNNAGPGISIVSNDSGAVNVSINNSIISNNGNDGVQLYSAGAGSVAFSVTGNTITGNCGDGVHVTSVGTGLLSATVSSNTASGNSLAGISVVAANGLNQTLVTGNNVNGNGGFGIVLTRQTPPGTDPQFTATASGNTVTNNAQAGIFAGDLTNQVSPSTPYTINLIGNATAGNQGSGISVASDGFLANSNMIAHVESNTLTGDNGGVTGMGGFEAKAFGIGGGTGSLSLVLQNNTSAPVKGPSFNLDNFGGSFIFQNGGGNSAGLSSAGPITPGVVP